MASFTVKSFFSSLTYSSSHCHQHYHNCRHADQLPYAGKMSQNKLYSKSIFFVCRTYAFLRYRCQCRCNCFVFVIIIIGIVSFPPLIFYCFLEDDYASHLLYLQQTTLICFSITIRLLFLIGYIGNSNLTLQ